ASSRTRLRGATRHRSRMSTATARSLGAVRSWTRWSIVMTDSPKTVEQFCLDHGIDAKQLAERSGVDEQRIVAILLGRWTPSPQDRDRIAAALGVTREQIIWGHKTPVQHLYGQGPA